VAYCWNHSSWRRRGWWWLDWIFGGRSFAAEVQSFHEFVFGGRRRLRPSIDFPNVIYRDDVEQEKVVEGEELLVEFFEGT